MSNAFVPRCIAIVGANLAGARAAEALRQRGYDGELLLVGEEPLRPYERPPLSKDALLNGAATPQWVHGETFYAEKNIDLLTGCAVVALKAFGLRRFELSLSDGSKRDADTVLLTTGGSPRKLPGDAGDGIVHYIRRWEDAVRLRPTLRSGARLVVIGSGFIGAEVAATAVACGCQVTIIEAMPRLFPSIPSLAVADAMARFFSHAGVTAVGARSVVEVSGSSSPAAVLLDDGRTLEADAIVAGIGIEPRVELARMVAAETRRGVLVDRQFQTTVPGLYAAGDVCSIVDDRGELMHVEHWKAAQEQGAAAAHAILGLPLPTLSVPWCWSDQLGQRIEVAGSPRHSDEQVVRRISERELCVFHLRDKRLEGVVTLNAGRAMRTAMKLLEKHCKPDPEQLTDPGVPVNQVQLLD